MLSFDSNSPTIVNTVSQLDHQNDDIIINTLRSDLLNAKYCRTFKLSHYAVTQVNCLWPQICYEARSKHASMKTVI